MEIDQSNDHHHREYQEKGMGYLIGKVYPRDDCFMAGPGKTSVTDNIPFEVLGEMDLTGVPLTDGHPPLDQVANDHPGIARGKVVRSMTIDGDKYIIANVDRNNPNSVAIIDDIKHGRKMGLSLGHQCSEEINPNGHIESREFKADHVGIVKTPRRPGCYIHHFWSEEDNLVDSMGYRDIKEIMNRVGRLPGERVTTTIAGDNGHEIEYTEFRPSHCELGCVARAKDSGDLYFADELPEKKENKFSDQIEVSAKPPSLSAADFLAKFEKKSQNKSDSSYRKDEITTFKDNPISSSSSFSLAPDNSISLEDKQMATPTGQNPVSSVESGGGGGGTPSSTNLQSINANPVSSVSSATIDTPKNNNETKTSSSENQLKQQQQPRSSVTANVFLKRADGSFQQRMTGLNPPTENDGKESAAIGGNQQSSSSSSSSALNDETIKEASKIRISEIREDYANMDDSERLKVMKALMQSNREYKARDAQNADLVKRNEELAQRLAILEKEKADKEKMEDQKLSDDIVNRITTLIGGSSSSSTSSTDSQSRDEKMEIDESQKKPSNSILFLRKHGFADSASISSATPQSFQETMAAQLARSVAGHPITNRGQQQQIFEAQQQQQQQRALQAEQQQQPQVIDNNNQSSSSPPSGDVADGKKVWAETIKALDAGSKRKLSAYLASLGDAMSMSGAVSGQNVPQVNTRLQTMEVASLDEGSAQRNLNIVKRRRTMDEYGRNLYSEQQDDPRMGNYYNQQQSSSSSSPFPWLNATEGESGMLRSIEQHAGSLNELNSRSTEMAEQIQKQNVYSRGYSSNYSNNNRSDFSPFKMVDSHGNVMKE